MPLRGIAYSIAGLGKIAKRLFDLRIGGGGFEAGDFNFNDSGPNGSSTDFNTYYTNSQTSPSSGTLYVTWSNITGGPAGCTLLGYRLNGSYVGLVLYAEVGPPPYISLSAGDVLEFAWSACGEPFGATWEITLQNEDSSGDIVDVFTVTRGGCYLTTAVVQYKGLSDSGPELTAMRKLREHYRQVEGYDLLIQEYYENALKIIEAIGEDPETYEEIYRSVKICQAFVENENWQAAHDEYFRMYNDLKERYLR